MSDTLKKTLTDILKTSLRFCLSAFLLCLCCACNTNNDTSVLPDNGAVPYQEDDGQDTEDFCMSDVLLLQNDYSVNLKLLSLSNPVSDSLLYDDLHLYLSQGDKRVAGMETEQRDTALQWMMDRVDQLQEGMCARMVSEALGAAGLRSGVHYRYTPIAAAGSSCFNFVNESTGELNYKCEAYTWKDLLNHNYAPRKGDVVFFGLISSADMSMKQYAKYSDGNGYHVGMMRSDNSSINKISTVDGGQGADLLHIRTIDRSVNPVNGIFNIGHELNIYTTIFVRPCYQATFVLNAYLNYSNKNYVYGSDFRELDQEYYFSSDSVYQTLSVDENEKHDGCNSLKIENHQAGAADKSVIIKTLTMGASNHGDYVGDDRPMTLSFYAKADSKDTNLYFRWGYESTTDARSVTLTPYWQKYTIRMDKKVAYDYYMHLYADKAGTIWISELQLEDGKEATDFTAENEAFYDSTLNTYNLSSISYKLPEEPVRDGYVFEGWYDQARGGTKIDDSIDVKNGNFNVYAHWTKEE
ncbi:MAG: InlB B-repeat-containing protein [Erysipelotrichaceae bacterium]|nr:InlB B-repeat-containing protein [Erysipelotrichaceae bacterium]